jgi:CheY-like chemotaxis protein
MLISSVLDLKMPGVGGLELLKVIRRRHFSIPVIVVSGFISQDVAKALAATGVQGMVAKPFKQDRLEEELDRVATRYFGN